MRLEVVPAQLSANEQCATTFGKAVFTLRVSDSVNINLSIMLGMSTLILENGFQTVSKVSPLILTLGVNTALSWGRYTTVFFQVIITDRNSFCTYFLPLLHRCLKGKRNVSS